MRRLFGVLVDQVTASVAQISAATDVLEALPASLARLSEALGFNRVAVVEAVAGAAGPHRLLLQWTASGCPAPPVPPAALFPPPEVEALPEWSEPLQRAEPLVSLASSAPEPLRRFLGARGVQSSLTVPVLVESRPWGQIVFEDCRSEHVWPADGIKSLAMLAQIIGAAITREHFRRQARQREQLLQAVTLCAAKIGAAQDLREALDQSLAILGHAVDVDRMLLMEVPGEQALAPRRVLRNFWHRPHTPALVAQITQTTTLAPDPDVAGLD